MTPADLETARAFNAAGLVLLPGMSVVPCDGLGMCEVPDRVEAMDGDSTIITTTGARISRSRRVVNLDDPLTRAGLLVVVRIAHDDPSADVTYIDRSPLRPLWLWRAGQGMAGRIGEGPSEVGAFLAALQAAQAEGET
jgi:hypothetical protein